MENVKQSALDTAKGIIYGDREQTYGNPTINLERIAASWSLYIQLKYGESSGAVELTPEDVCWMMVDLKKCRQMHSPKFDNLVDAIGYVALVDRIGEPAHANNTGDVAVSFGACPAKRAGATINYDDPPEPVKPPRRRVTKKKRAAKKARKARKV